jgi:hypothetical protein
MGTASFFTHVCDAAVRERVRAAIAAELGSAWVDHFRGLP